MGIARCNKWQDVVQRGQLTAFRLERRTPAEADRPPTHLCDLLLFLDHLDQIPPAHSRNILKLLDGVREPVPEREREPRESRVSWGLSESINKGLLQLLQCFRAPLQLPGSYNTPRKRVASSLHISEDVDLDAGGGRRALHKRVGLYERTTSPSFALGGRRTDLLKVESGSLISNIRLAGDQQRRAPRHSQA